MIYRLPWVAFLGNESRGCEFPKMAVDSFSIVRSFSDSPSIDHFIARTELVTSNDGTILARVSKTNILDQILDADIMLPPEFSPFLPSDREIIQFRTNFSFVRTMYDNDCRRRWSMPMER